MRDRLRVPGTREHAAVRGSGDALGNSLGNSLGEMPKRRDAAQRGLKSAWAGLAFAPLSRGRARQSRTLVRNSVQRQRRRTLAHGLAHRDRV
ncbi:MAG: hypothetical protein U0168_00620 [Nannocystaceae bacterium]